MGEKLIFEEFDDPSFHPFLEGKLMFGDRFDPYTKIFETRSQSISTLDAPEHPRSRWISQKAFLPQTNVANGIHASLQPCHGQRSHDGPLKS